MFDKRRNAWTSFLPQRTVIMGRLVTPVTVENKSDTDSLEEISAQLEGCTRCGLSKSRKNIVVGEGNPRARLVFVGEGPGENEDEQGRPFVGKAGQLLEKMILAIGLKREEVYICNVVKCRPPGNRNPEPEEIATCQPFLERQLEVIQPEIIMALGKFAAGFLLGREVKITKERGSFGTYRGIKVMPSYHPSYLLRTPSAKKDAWVDLQKVAKELGLVLPIEIKK